MSGLTPQSFLLKYGKFENDLLSLAINVVTMI